METAVLTERLPASAVATKDGKHATQIVNEYAFFVTCSCGWKSPVRGSHTFAVLEAQAHRAEHGG